MAGRVAVLRAWLAKGAQAARPGAAGENAVPLAPPPAWLAELPEAERMVAYAAAAGRRLLAWSFDPEEDCFFRGDDPVALLGHSPGLLALRATSRVPLPAIDALDPLACLLRFEAVSDASRESIEEHMRYVVERIEIREIAPRDLAIPVGMPAKAPVFADFSRLARQHLAAGDRDALARAIATLLAMVAPASIQASALRWCTAHLACFGFDRRADLEALIGAVESGAGRSGRRPTRSRPGSRTNRRRGPVARRNPRIARSRSKSQPNRFASWRPPPKPGSSRAGSARSPRC